MKITVWGCRGSITTPGPETVRYGGNTTCLEIRTASGKLLVVDAGSGLRNLGKALLKEKELTDIAFVFTHSHWDHLIGFPFFAPVYQPQYRIALCGGPNAKASLKQYLTHQMETPYFPVDFSHLKAKFTFGCRCPSVDCRNELDGLGSSFKCQSIALNHPNAGYGFRFTEGGKAFVFLTDNELGFRHKGGRQRKKYVEFCQGADLLFHDAQYTEEDYENTRGWGHSTYRDATLLAIDAGVKRLGLFHHDPDRTDEDLDRQVEACRAQIRAAGSKLDCFAVAEGMVIDLGRNPRFPG